MTLPRFADSVVVDNVVLTVATCLLALVALSVVLALSLWALRRSAEATGLKKADALTARLQGPVRSFGLLSAAFIVLACCAGLAVSVYTETDLNRWLNGHLAALGPDAWLSLGRAFGVGGALLVFSFWLARTLRPLLPRLEKRLVSMGAFQDEVEAVRGLVGQLHPLLNVAVVYATVRLLSVGVGLPPNLGWVVSTVVYVVLVLTVTRTLIYLVDLATEAADRLGRTRFSGARHRPYYEGVRGLWPLARRTFEAVAWIGAVTIIVGELHVLESFAPYGPRVIRLIAIYFVARVVVELSRVLVAESLSRHVDPRDEVAKRRATLIFLVQSVTKYVLYFGAVILMMGELGIDPAPFLAGAGIIGLTVGLGAQKLVNDMVSGFFMLFEGQLLTGDYVRIGDVEGIVEAVHLRVTEIRDADGRLHTLRNGNIEHIVNFSRDYVNAVVDIGVAYGSDLDLAWEAIREAGRRLHAEFPDAVMKETVIVGVEQMGDSAVIIRTVTQVHPGQHLPVSRAMRRHLLEAIPQAGVEIPFPHYVLIHQNAQAGPGPVDGPPLAPGGPPGPMTPTTPSGP
ncbi:mechanosensitive ion channel family protein [Myxococcota bacterium]|nr:mechanosensitive ion channel family protein [Myxococcota bacterium]